MKIVKIVKLSGSYSGNLEDVTPTQLEDVEQHISDRDFIVPSNVNNIRVERKKLQELRKRKKEELKELNNLSASNDWYKIVLARNIDWELVDSSFIDSVAYDEDIHSFHIRLRSGKKYSFKNVPKKVYENLLKAKSKGKAFNEIKRNYELY